MNHLFASFITVATFYAHSLNSLQLFNQPNSRLENLRVSDLKIKTRTPTRSGIKLPSIHVFDVSGSPILAHFFLNTPAREGFVLTELTTLKMSRCNIKTFDESLLLSKAPNIERLDLSHNPLECTCYGLSWIPHYVREDKLSLLGEENTTCASPHHLTGVPLLTATLCPIVFPSKEQTTIPHIIFPEEITFTVPPTSPKSSTLRPISNTTFTSKQPPNTTTSLPLTTMDELTTTEVAETSTTLAAIAGLFIHMLQN